LIKEGEAMKHNEIRDNEGAAPERKRVGRGIGSGKGKTCGRGHKGQKSRRGKALGAFEGGQMPLHRRLPKRGFNNKWRKEFVEVNLDQLQKAIDNGRLDASQPVDAAAVRQAGLAKRTRDGVRVLGRGELSAKLDLVVAGASKTARQAVEAAGGSVTIENADKIAAAEARKTKRGKGASADNG
jgi:large subunit ribosomal protein L15